MCVPDKKKGAPEESYNGLRLMLHYTWLAR